MKARPASVAFNFSPHAHEEFMIVVTEEGAALHRFWGAVQRVGPGDVLVLSPGEVHGVTERQGADVSRVREQIIRRRWDQVETDLQHTRLAEHAVIQAVTASGITRDR